MTKQQYQTIIWEFLQKMKPGVVEEIDFLPNRIIPNQMAKAFFVDIVKGFIEADPMGKVNGWYIEFSNDYQRLKKFVYIAPRPESQPEAGSAVESHQNQSGGKILQHA